MSICLFIVYLLYYWKLTVLPPRDRVVFHSEVENFISKYFPSEVNTNDEIQQTQLVGDCFISFDDDGSTDSELMRYIHQPISCEVNMKTWWFDNSKTYPSLFKLFMKLSCIPATTASSERAFSASGNIVTDKRSMILPKHVNNLVVLRNKV